MLESVSDRIKNFQHRAVEVAQLEQLQAEFVEESPP
jgi:hypothetical protein